MLLISSCLLGLFSKYNGIESPHPLLLEYCRRGQLIPVCPEQMGGLATPRRPVELCGGDGYAVLSGKARAMADDGSDCTEAFRRGAGQLLNIASLLPVRAAILKEGSPSCGSSYIYDGQFSHTRITGNGVAAALLKQHGITVYSEETITRDILEQILPQINL